MSTTKVSLIGGAGYGAAEILRHLLVREDVEILRIASKDYVGESVSKVHRSLGGYESLILQDLSPRQCAEGADIVFLAMPHIATAKVAMQLFDMDVRLIDLSGDFRLHTLADYVRDYAPEHPCPERLGSFVYGMPELHEHAIRQARHVASPGCFATAIAMGLLPLAAAGLLQGVTVRNVSMTGSTGSGVRPQAGTHHATRVNNLKTYKTLHHQHRAELVQTLCQAGGQDIALDFVPVSAPLARGILAVSQLDVPAGHTSASLQQLYEAYYAAHKLVTVMPPGSAPEVVAVAGSARVEVGLTLREDPDTGVRTLCCTSAIDNLIKGGAGQAVQSFNLMTGKPMHFGLDAPGLWP